MCKLSLQFVTHLCSLIELNSRHMWQSSLASKSKYDSEQACSLFETLKLNIFFESLFPNFHHKYSFVIKLAELWQRFVSFKLYFQFQFQFSLHIKFEV